MYDDCGCDMKTKCVLKNQLENKELSVSLLCTLLVKLIHYGCKRSLRCGHLVLQYFLSTYFSCKISEAYHGLHSYWIENTWYLKKRLPYRNVLRRYIQEDKTYKIMIILKNSLLRYFSIYLQFIL